MIHDDDDSINQSIKRSMKKKSNQICLIMIWKLKNLNKQKRKQGRRFIIIIIILVTPGHFQVFILFVWNNVANEKHTHTFDDNNNSYYPLPFIFSKFWYRIFFSPLIHGRRFDIRKKKAKKKNNISRNSFWCKIK